MTPMIDVVFLLLVFFVCASVGQAPDSLLPAQLKGNSATAVAVPATEMDDWDRPTINIRLTVPAGDATGIALNSAPVRSFEELAEYLYRENEFPHGAYLMTGTGIVPDSPFTLEKGDVVRIEIAGIGVLENEVE